MKSGSITPGGKSKVFTPFVFQLLLIMFVVEFVKGALLITMLPVYMRTVLGLSAFLIGWSLALQYIGDNLFRSPVGWMIDRIGYRSSMLFGLILAFTSVLILATQTHFIWIILASIILGIGSSPLWPCVISGTTELAGANPKGTIMSVVYMAWLSGVGLGPVVINFFVRESYGPAFRMLIVMMAAVILVALFLPGKNRHPLSPLKMEEGDQYKKRFNSRTLQPVGRMDRVRKYFRDVRNSLHVSIWLFPAMFAQTFALGILTPILTLYARTVMRLTPGQYSMFLAAGGLITVVFLIPVGKLVDRWGTRWFLHIGFLLGSLTLYFFTYFTSLRTMMVLVCILGLAYALIIPAWNALIAEAIPERERGAVWGFFLTIEGLGMIVGPIVSGKLWDTLGHHAPFLTSATVLFILFVLHVLIAGEKKVAARS